MNLVNFLLLLQRKEIENYSVICFVGKQYPILFFNILKNIIHKIYGFRVQSLDFSLDNDNKGFEALFEISFLGNTLFYWLGNINNMSADVRRRFMFYIKNYKGPHSIWFFTEVWQEPFNENFCLIKLEEKVKNFDETEQLIVILTKFLSTDVSSLDFVDKSSWSLEELCLFLYYCMVLKRPQIREFRDNWLDKIIIPEKSLFTLSGYFFAKDIKAFFVLWQKISKDFGSLFWISFWSEQLFRAGNFIFLTKKNMHEEAKKISYKLPFSFIKKDWKKSTFNEITAAHNALYVLDYSLKNGGSESFIDLFFINFFENNFSKENINV